MATGPIGPPPRPRRAASYKPLFTTWASDGREGDPASPRIVVGQRVVEQLRIRRDAPGGLWLLADGRYAVTGPIAAAGGRKAMIDWANGRLRHADEDERAWLQTVIGGDRS